MRSSETPRTRQPRASVEVGDPQTQSGEPARLVDESKLREELGGWLKAREEASRCNRNLLQYGAGMAAAFGVGAGSGGILAISNSLTQNGIGSLEIGSFLFWVLGSVFVMSYVAMAIAAILAVLLIFAFFRRQSSEKEVSRRLENLVILLPYHFLPDKEELVPGLADR